MVLVCQNSEEGVECITVVQKWVEEVISALVFREISKNVTVEMNWEKTDSTYYNLCFASLVGQSPPIR